MINYLLCSPIQIPTKPVFAAANQAVVDTTLDEEIDEKEEVRLPSSMDVQTSVACESQQQHR